MDFASRVFVARYTPEAVLKITGGDAFTFLQGQFTQDLRGCVGTRNVAYGLWLNQKGKVMADSFVLRSVENVWWVISFFCRAAVIRERLEAYVIADDVIVDDVTAQWAGAAVVGEDATAVVGKVAGAVPVDGGFLDASGGMLFRGRRDGGETWEWLYPRDTTAPVDAFFAASATEIGEPELELRRIRAGLPRVPRDVGAEDLPNEAGLERVAISFNKGCYLGQEVMARLNSMGQVRRKLIRVAGEGAVPTPLPAPLFAGQKKVGELRSAVPTANGFAGLAMISTLTLGGVQALSAMPDGPAGVTIESSPGV